MGVELNIEMQEGRELSTPGPASEWAAGRQPGTPLRWREFEAAAYAEHDEVRQAVSGEYRVSRLAGLAMLAGIVIFLGPIVGTVLCFVGWLRSDFGPHADPTAHMHWGGLLFVLAVLSQGFVIIAVVVVVLATVQAAPTEVVPGPARGPARAAVAKLTDAERDAVRVDLEAALDDLADRKVISHRERKKVRDAPLGMLSVAQSAPRRRM